MVNHKLSILFKEKRFYIGLSILILGIALNQISSIYLNKNYPALPVLNDLILDNLPLFNIGWVSDLFAVLSVIMFICYSFFKKIEYTPYYLTLFGILQIIRGIFISLTPFANPTEIYSGFMNISMFRSGVYPSGHTGISFIAFLLSKGVWKFLFLLLSLGTIIFLLLAKRHYSIDIFSALMFVYAIYMFGEKYIKDKLKCYQSS